jgi:methoxymalonate biosynthesis acyl carrier protein
MTREIDPILYPGDMNRKIKRFLETNLNKNRDELDPVIQLAEDDDIFQQGSSDSLLVMKLLKFVEDEFRVRVDNDELEIENFSTVTRVVRLIERLREKKDRD